MSERRLIVNADDFGFSRHVTDTIVHSHRFGIVTSTTLMVNMPAAEYAARAAREVPSLGVGLHLNLTEGRPTAPIDAVPALVDDQGDFPGNAAQTRRIQSSTEAEGQIEIEIDAQLKRCIDLGVQPTHCDSHHGIHKLPAVRRALVRAMRRHGISKARTPLSRHRLVPRASLSARWIWLQKNLRRAPSIAVHAWSHRQLRRAGIATPDWKATRSMGIPARNDPKDEILACIAATPRGVSEILLHPGSFGPEENPSAWRRKTWAEDTPICVDPEVVSRIRELGIELISFRDL